MIMVSFLRNFNPVSSIRNEGNETFCAQKFHLKSRCNLTFHCLFVVEIHKRVQILTDFIDFLSTTF